MRWVCPMEKEVVVSDVDDGSPAYDVGIRSGMSNYQRSAASR